MIRTAWNIAGTTLLTLAMIAAVLGGIALTVALIWILVIQLVENPQIPVVGVSLALAAIIRGWLNRLAAY